MRTAAALFCSALWTLLPAAPAQASQPDFANTAAFDNSCTGLKRSLRMTVQEQQAFVICKDVALVQHIWTFVERGAKRLQDGQVPPGEVALAVRSELTHAREQIRQSRQMLERIRIKSASDGLLIMPATWVRDLNGDGTIQTAERYFFAIPARKDAPLRVGTPSEEDDYYAAEYNLDAAIRLDQSDIDWALSYHYFTEALLEMALSYQHRADQRAPMRSLVLAHPEGMRRAHQLLVSGMQTSEKMRRAVLAETDDDLEWIANPRQANTVFPVPMDDADFRVWGELMAHLIPLGQGRTLLPKADKMAGDLDALARLCPAGQGFSIPAFFQQPPRYPLELTRDRQAGSYCRKIDAAHPATGLYAFIQTYADKPDQTDSAALRYLRRLLWVN